MAEVDLDALKRRVEEMIIEAGKPGLKAEIIAALERAERVEKALGDLIRLCDAARMESIVLEMSRAALEGRD